MSRKPRWTQFVPMTAALFAVTSVGCAGSCAGNLAPLPGGKLPADQTVEGGGQVRVTPTGLAKIAKLIPAAVNAAFANGVCVPASSQTFIGQTASTCYNDDCNGGVKGCKVNLTVDSLNWAVTDPKTLEISGTFDVDAPSIPVRLDTSLGTTSCALSATAKNIALDIDIALTIDPNTGELKVNLAGIHKLDLSGLTVSGCSFASDVINFVTNLLSTSIGNDILNLLSPLLNNLLQKLFPTTPGVTGVVDLGALLSAYAPGAQGKLEARLVPGGYGAFGDRGISIGLITGFNSDRDPSTRTPDLDSQPALCVPPLSPPDFSQPPASLPTTSRGTFSLAPADAFSGNPDPNADVAIGLSKTTLNLLGHHLVTSGALCLDVGNQKLPQLNLGTIGLLVPSLADLGDGTDPMMVVTRPQQAISFSVGDGTKDSPRITVHVHQLKVDMYAYLFQSWVRGFTISVDLDLGINLDFTTDAQGNPEIMPTLVGLNSKNVHITVENAEFLREKASQVASVFPSLLDALVPMLAGKIKPMPLPALAGFKLSNLSVNKVTTSQDDFVAIDATLGAATAPLRKLAEKYPALAHRLKLDTRLRGAAAPQPVVTHASLARVTAPAPAAMRAALAGKPGGALPKVVIDVTPTDALGRPLEWTWSLDGGMWRAFTRDAPLVIRDRSLALEGPHTVRVRARVVGDYRTLDPTGVSIPFVIDSAPPRILTDKASISGGELTVPAVDLVSPPKDVTVAFGRADGEMPATDWGQGTIALSAVKELAGSGGTVRVYAKDGSGNRSVAVLDVAALLSGSVTTPRSGGCAIALASSGRSGVGFGAALALLAGLLGLLALRSRAFRRRVGRGAAATILPLTLFIVIAVAASLTTACEGSPSLGAGSCQTADDCVPACSPGQVPTCSNNMCLCNDDVPLGRVGSDSAMALAGDESAWVSAYNSTHGDLMVAHYSGSGRIPNSDWKFIDGVPSGPVVVKNSHVRGGITAPGDDVGQYTDIAVAPDGTVMVSYFDKTHNTLKFAANYGGTWSTQTVDAGGHNSIAGMYSSLTIRNSDGRPAIAYFAAETNGSFTTTEVRYAAARTAQPHGPGDWVTTKVDSLAVPTKTSGDVYPIPEGVGLYIDSARLSNGGVIVAYYDRTHGEVKASTLDSKTGAFSTPVVLAGADGSDVGLYPSIAVEKSGDVRVTYASANRTQLYYVDSITGTPTPTVVDDGYRIDGETATGLPEPVFHFVGARSSLVIAGGIPFVAYQDATSHELLLAHPDATGTWQHSTVAGGTKPFKGGYGFFTSAAADGPNVVISNWVIDQPNYDSWVEIERPQLIIQ